LPEKVKQENGEYLDNYSFESTDLQKGALVIEQLPENQFIIKRINKNQKGVRYG